eukprot:GHVU01155758.1.p1 GENE.GHVU01155758.1~~GHVU01155758.1.p1  ORF type:complete len:249 (-),score=41.55 GHVU01155758.1:99-845(-)
MCVCVWVGLRGGCVGDQESLERGLGEEFAESYGALDWSQQRELVDEMLDATSLAYARLQGLHRQFAADAPPVTPQAIARLSAVDFSDMLDKYKPRLRLLSEDNSDVGWQRLRLQLQTEQSDMHRDTVAKVVSMEIPFEQQWWTRTPDAIHGQPLATRYPMLFAFVCGPASVYTGNSEVERDFGVLKSYNANDRSGISISSLTGTMHCRHMEELRELTPLSSTEVHTDDDEDGVAAPPQYPQTPDDDEF